MDARRRLTQLRLVFAFVLAIGLSGAAAAATTTGSAVAKPAVPSLAQLSASAATTQAATMRAATALRHAIAKHRTPATAGAGVVAAISLAGLVTCFVRRRRTEPALRHHALSHGARAPPAVTQH
jgi:hypothetical protein